MTRCSACPACTACRGAASGGYGFELGYGASCLLPFVQGACEATAAPNSSYCCISCRSFDRACGGPSAAIKLASLAAFTRAISRLDCTPYLRRSVPSMAPASPPFMSPKAPLATCYGDNSYCKPSGCCSTSPSC